MKSVTSDSHHGLAVPRHVYSVQRYVEFTAPRYSSLMKPGLLTHPICYFGNPATAKIITVGLNPSHGEFDGSRWLGTVDHQTLANRCSTYFSHQAEPRPHRWFKPWHLSLEHLDHSYEDGSAVHLDLSPRATRFVSELKEAWEQSLFLEMVERDLWTFFATLELCANAKVLLIAGTVTGRFYLNEFLQRFAPDYGYSLGGAFRRTDCPGKGKTCFHSFSRNGRTLPVFFCSSSPSDSNNRELLPKRVGENAQRIKDLLR